MYPPPVPSTESHGPGRALLAGCGAVVLLAVIAAAAGATHASSGQARGSDPVWLLDLTMCVLAGVLAIGAVMTAAGWLPWLDPGKERKEKDLWERIATGAVLVVILGVLLWVLFLGHRKNPVTEGILNQVRQQQQQQPKAAPPVPPINWNYPLITVLIVLAGIAL